MRSLPFNKNLKDFSFNLFVGNRISEYTVWSLAQNQFLLRQASSNQFKLVQNSSNQLLVQTRGEGEGKVRGDEGRGA